MKLKVKIMGSKDLTFEPEAIRTMEHQGELYAMHEGHNSLMHTFVLTHWETGVPLEVTKRDPTVDVDEALIERYLNYFKKMSKFASVNWSKFEKINDLPEKPA